MAENTPSNPSFFTTLKSGLTNRRSLIIIAIALALGMAGAALGSHLYLKPMRAIAEKRYQSHLCLIRLYDLQIAYHAAHETYANDLDTLLATAPDAAELRAQLKNSVDINTLTVVGDAERFRLEANVLDEQRTSVKIRGPLGKR